MDTKDSVGISKLSLVWRERPGYDARGVSACRKYLDFLIDGLALSAFLDEVHDRIRVLGWMAPEYDERRAAALLGEPSTLEGGRVEFYVCPECGILDVVP